MYIYLDVVLGINLFINTFLLLLTAWILNIPWKKSRLGLALLSSSFYVYASIVYPHLPLLHPLSKLLMSFLLLSIAFGRRSLSQFLLLTIAFYAVSFLVGGAILGYYFFLRNGGFAEFDLGFGAADVIFGALFTAGLVYGFAKPLLKKKQQAVYLYDMIIEYGKEQICLRALFDSGNHLYEMAGGSPVVLVERQALSPLFSAEVNQFLENTAEKEWLQRWQDCADDTWCKSFVLIAYRSVGAADFLIGQRVKRVKVKQAEGWREFECVIGIYNRCLSPDHSYQALLHAGMDLN